MNMKLLLVAAFLGFAGISYGDPLRLDTDKAKAGQKVSFNYNAGLGKLSGATELRAVLFYYTATKGAGYYAEDCSLKPAGKDQWKGNFVVPDSAIAWALRFRSGKLTEDNGGTGYIAPVYDKSGVRPEAYAGMALLYANGESMLAIGNRSDTGMVLLEKEFSLHPDMRSKYEGAWYNMLVNTKKQDAYPVLEARIQGLMAVAAPSLADYQLAMRLYQLQKKKKQADSIIAIAAVRYPGSVMAVQCADNSFYKIRDIDSMITAYENFMTQYGHTAPLDPATQVSDFFASSISQKYIQQKKYRAAIVYASKMTDAMADYRGYMYSWVAIDLVRADSALALADSLVGIALAGLDHEQAHPELFRKTWIGVADWKADMDRYYRSAFYDTYGRVLFAQGDASKAVTAQLRSVTLAKGENNGFNEHYIKYLLRSGDVKAARERAATYIRSNTASDSVKIWFKEIYVKENGSDKGYAEYVSGLQQSATAKFRETALKEKLDLPMKAFSLRGLDGKEVSLVSLRGKVVVVDFWATWCGPCKASFPAMQTAVDKYRNDSNVVFLFVDTWESLTEDQRFAQVKKFIADNKYRFHVLFDSVVDLEKRQYSVVSDYGVGGIPTKFVLDRDGRIVFKAVGFDGNNEKLVTELSVYIDLAKG